MARALAGPSSDDIPWPAQLLPPPPQSPAAPSRGPGSSAPTAGCDEGARAAAVEATPEPGLASAAGFEATPAFELPEEETPAPTPDASREANGGAPDRAPASAPRSAPAASARRDTLSSASPAAKAFSSQRKKARSELRQVQPAARTFSMAWLGEVGLAALGEVG